LALADEAAKDADPESFEKESRKTIDEANLRVDAIATILNNIPNDGDGGIKGGVDSADEDELDGSVNAPVGASYNLRGRRKV
jgi:hypothetical protein